MYIYPKLLPVILFTSLLTAWLPPKASTTLNNRLSPSLLREIQRISGNVLGNELEELLAVSNLQEIVWRLKEHGAANRAAELQALLLDRLDNGAVRDMYDTRRGILVELDDGLLALFKTIDGQFEGSFRREVLLYRMDNLIGTHVVPMTTARTLDGEEGSLQLFVEHSLLAYDIVAVMLKQLGIEYDMYDYLLSEYPFLSVAFAPPISPAVRTLRLLSLEYTPTDTINYRIPYHGRQIATGGELAFSSDDSRVEEHIRHLREHPEAYLLDPNITANIETKLENFILSSLFDTKKEDSIAAQERSSKDNINEITNMLSALSFQEEEIDTMLTLITQNAPNYIHGQGENIDSSTQKETSSIASLLHRTSAAYKEMVENIATVEKRKYIVQFSEEDAARVLLAAFDAEDWHKADQLLAFHEHFYQDIELLAKKMPVLYDWLERKPEGRAEYLEYALYTGNYEFAARLSSLGVQTKDNLKPLHENLLHAIAKERNINDLTIDWNNIDWGTIDWEKVRTNAESYPLVTSESSNLIDISEHLIYALQTGDLRAVDHMLRKFTTQAGAEQVVVWLLNSLNNDYLLRYPQRVEWFLTHDVILQKLPPKFIANSTPDPDRLNYYVEKLMLYTIRYVKFLPNEPKQTKQSLEQILSFVSQLFAHYQFTDKHNDLYLLFEMILENHLSWDTINQQQVERLQWVVNIFQKNRMGKKLIDVLHRELDKVTKTTEAPLSKSR